MPLAPPPTQTLSLLLEWTHTCNTIHIWHMHTFETRLRVPWTVRSNQSVLKQINPEYSQKDWCWSWRSNTLAICCEELTHWKRPWCWERLKAGGEGDDRGWDGWMASLTQWVWVNSRRQWRTGKPGVLPTMGLQRARYNLVTCSVTYICIHTCVMPYIFTCVCVSCSVMSNFVSPWTVAPRLLCSWNSPGKNTGEGSHSLLQGKNPTLGSNPGSPVLQVDSLPSEPPEKYIFTYTHI